MSARRENRPQRIVLSGTFHSGNRGDASMQLAAAMQLQTRWPDTHVVLLSCDPGADAPVYPGICLQQSLRRRPAHALLQVVRALVFGGPGRDLELQTIAGADTLLDLSGDGFTETFGWKCPASHAVPLILARLLGVPCVMMGQTIGPFRRARSFYRWLFSGVDAILCRDEESIRALADLGVGPDPATGRPAIQLTADVAFLLEGATAQDLAQSVPWLEEFSGGAPLVGVTPSNLFNVRSRGEKDRILQVLAAAADRLADLSEGRVLVIPTVFGPGPGYDDRNAGRRLCAMLRRPNRARLVTEELPPGELRALIGSCASYVGVRMHGLIHALSQAVPCVGLAYGAKTQNLFRRLGLSAFALDLAGLSAEQCAQAAAELWQERDRVRVRLREALADDILPAARRNFDTLDRDRTRHVS